MRSCCLRPDSGRRIRCRGFTLLEALATLVVVLLAFVALADYIDDVQRAWQSAAADPFAEAASAFETVTRTLAAATLEPYQDYADAGGAFPGAAGAPFTPYQLARRSDLAFVCGPSSGPGGLLAATGRTTATSGVFFTAPAGQTQVDAQDGLNRLLNAEGYFVEFGGDSNVPSFFTGLSRQRWRLKEVVQPSEALQVFASTTSAPWIAQLTGSNVTPSILAENVIALVIVPEKAAAQPIANFAYDSRAAAGTVTFAQLPPLAHVVLVAIDEPSAQRLAGQDGTAAPALVSGTLFQDATQVSTDVTTLDASLTAARIEHRIFQRDVVMASSAWVNAP
jgi:uncharacterized protein (TIGR02599 family)